eukprot:97858-Chlamydomonas_euryale.AAC.2
MVRAVRQLFQAAACSLWTNKMRLKSNVLLDELSGMLPCRRRQRGVDWQQLSWAAHLGLLECAV